MSSFKCPPEGADCSIEGEADLYGMGIRLGIYVTWMASWIANTFLPDEIDQALDTNSIFLVAISFGTIFYAGLEQMRVIDGPILIQLSFGYIFTVMTIWGYRTACYRREGARACRRFGAWGTHLRLFLLASLATYAIYFWTKGIRHDLPSCNRRENCGGLRVFVFQPLSLDAPKKFCLSIAILCCLHYVPMFLAAFAWLCRLLVRDWRNPGRPAMNLLKQRIGHECLKAKEFARISYVMAIFTFSSGVFWVVAIEKTLLDNHVAGVGGGRLTSAGQLIPLCIGVLGLIKVAFACILAKFERTDAWNQITYLRLLNAGDTHYELQKFSGGKEFQEARSSRWRAALGVWLPWSMAFLYPEPLDAEPYKKFVLTLSDNNELQLPDLPASPPQPPYRVPGLADRGYRYGSREWLVPHHDV